MNFSKKKNFLTQLASAFFCLFLTSAQAEQAPVKVGILDTIDPFFFVWSFGDTMEHLRKEFPEKRIVSQELSYDELQKAITAKELDFFIAPSGFFKSIEESSGARHLATFHREVAGDPGRSVGSVFIKRKGDERFHKIEDLKNASFSATDPNSFDGWIIAKGEMLNRNLDVDKIEKRTLFTGYGLPDVVTFVLNETIDIGILKACELERLIRDGTIPPNSLEVINEKNTAELRCKVSTDLYPDVVFASLPKAPSDLIKSISIALFSMPPVGEGSWGFASDFSTVSDLYKSLKMGPYEYLRKTTPQAIFQEYRPVFYGLFALLLLGLIYIATVNRVVRIRTRDLQIALKKKEEAQEEAKSTQEKLFQMEKAGVVQELSAMFAHEAHQPIASLINYADGLKMYLENKKQDELVVEAVTEISAQAQRLSDIIKRVRSYAKKEARELKLSSLDKVVNNAIEHAQKTQSFKHTSFTFKRLPEAQSFVDSLEIELVIYNLLKNALAAVKDSAEAMIQITMEDNGKFWNIVVQDNGEPISDEIFQQLSQQPMHSRKENGLGLGLSICRVIAESHAGKISFKRWKGGGLAAILSLPKAN